MDKQLQDMIDCNAQLLQLIKAVMTMVPELQAMVLQMALDLARNAPAPNKAPALRLVPHARVYQD